MIVYVQTKNLKILVTFSSYIFVLCKFEDLKRKKKATDLLVDYKCMYYKKKTFLHVYVNSVVTIFLKWYN